MALVSRLRNVLTSSGCRSSAGLFGKDLLDSFHASYGTKPDMHGTTVLCVRRADKVIIMADGQVTRGSEVVKPNVRKVRRIGDGSVIAGFAGGTADAISLFERLESRLEEHSGQLMRAAVEVAKDWRTDKYLRRLEAIMVVADKKQSLTLTGDGDILEAHDGIIAIGSGGGYALAAARALIENTDLDAHAIAKSAMTIAARYCIYTNDNFTEEWLECEEPSLEGGGSQEAGRTAGGTQGTLEV
eukprot:jgi/Botrbrau1/2731/Bobra.0164s0011.1